MKKLVSLLLFFVTLICVNNADAACNCNQHSGKNHHCNHNHSSSSGNSQPAYVVRTEQTSSEENFPDCSKHYMKTNTTTNYYSDGTKRVYTNSTIYNKDGSVLVSDCYKISHLIDNNNHYFVICKNKGGCSIINSKGENVTTRNYSNIDVLTEQRFLVKYEKKYGIIDLKENVIVPIKYQKFKKTNQNHFITKLNGYYGILDTENNILVKNECEKIKLLYNTIILKRYGKYGLADLDGKIIYDIQYDKIKCLGEYILLRKGKQYLVLNDKGELISNQEYKKIKLVRNTLYGYIDRTWVKVLSDM